MPNWLNLNNAPVWMPLLALLRDFLAFQYIFSFEPGITEHAVRVGYLWMLPGSLAGGGFVAVGSNLLFALAAGLISRWYVGVGTMAERSANGLQATPRQPELSWVTHPR